MVNRNSVCFLTITWYKNDSQRTRHSISLSEITKLAYLQWECFNRAELDVLRITNVSRSQMKRVSTCKCVFFFFSYVSEPNQLLPGFKLLSIYEHFQFDSCIQLYIYRDSISLASISRSVYVDYPAIIEFSTLTRPISSRIERNCFNANNRGLNSVKPGHGTVTFFPWKQSISWQRFEARAATFAGSCYGDVVVDTVDVEQRACVFPEVRSFQVDVSFMISQTDLSFWRSSFLCFDFDNGSRTYSNIYRRKFLWIYCALF